MDRLLQTIESQIRNGCSVQVFEDQYHACLETLKTDVPLAVKYLKRLSDLIELSMVSFKWGVNDIREIYGLHKKVCLTAAPHLFELYLLYVEWDREPEKKFYVPRRSVLKEVVDAMQDLIDDKLDLLTISMPPGSGKSTLGIFFLSWVMGKFPDKPNLASAHSGILTRSFFDGVLEVITDPEYLWADVFPGHALHSTNTKEETIDLVKKHRFSTLTCRAINASLTGATRCEMILYADDLVSGIEEAMSKDRLDKLWISYTNDLKQELIKEVVVPCYSYQNGTLEESLISEEITVANGDVETFFIGEPSYKFRVTLDGSTSGVSIVASGNYYVTLKFTTSGTARLEVFGYRYKIVERYATKVLNNKGKTIKWENPLISDMTMAADLAEWLGEYYTAGIEYEYNTRGNPEIDVNDIVYQENEFHNDMKVNIYRHTLGFNQSFSGKVTARRIGG